MQWFAFLFFIIFFIIIIFFIEKYNFRIKSLMYKQSIVLYNASGWRLAPSLDTEDVIQFIMSNSLLEDVVGDQLLINIF